VTPADTGDGLAGATEHCKTAELLDNSPTLEFNGQLEELVCGWSSAEDFAMR